MDAIRVLLPPQAPQFHIHAAQPEPVPGRLVLEGPAVEGIPGDAWDAGFLQRGREEARQQPVEFEVADGPGVITVLPNLRGAAWLSFTGPGVVRGSSMISLLSTDCQSVCVRLVLPGGGVKVFSFSILLT